MHVPLFPLITGPFLRPMKIREARQKFPGSWCPLHRDSKVSIRTICVTEGNGCRSPIVRRRSAHAILPSRVRESDMAATEGKLAMRRREDNRWAAFQQLFAGIAAGVATAICTHPLDLIKTRMQSPKPLASFFFSVRVFGRRLIGS